MKRGLAALLVLGWPALAYANAGLPMLMVVWPLSMLAIAPVVLLEAWIVRRDLGLSWRVSLWQMTKANALSTFVGVPLTWIALVALEFGVAYVSTGVADSYPPRWVGEVGAVVLSAPWLGPFRTGGHWIVPLATAVLLVPFFFVSAWLEVQAVATAFAASGRSDWSKAVWKANLLSYGVLLTATLAWLAAGLVLGPKPLS